jgi:hypothetical protein
MSNTYPHEKLLFKLIEKEEWYQLDDLINFRYYIYLVAVVVMAISGMLFQYYIWNIGVKSIENDNNGESTEKTKQPMMTNEHREENNNFADNKVENRDD